MTSVVWRGWCRRRVVPRVFIGAVRPTELFRSFVGSRFLVSQSIWMHRQRNFVSEGDVRPEAGALDPVSELSMKPVFRHRGESAGIAHIVLYTCLNERHREPAIAC